MHLARVMRITITCDECQLAYHPQVMGKVLAIVNRAISTCLRGPI